MSAIHAGDITSTSTTPNTPPGIRRSTETTDPTPTKQPVASVIAATITATKRSTAPHQPTNAAARPPSREIAARTPSRDDPSVRPAEQCRPRDDQPMTTDVRPPGRRITARGPNRSVKHDPARTNRVASSAGLLSRRLPPRHPAPALASPRPKAARPHQPAAKRHQHHFRHQAPWSYTPGPNTREQLSTYRSAPFHRLIDRSAAPSKTRIW